MKKGMLIFLTLLLWAALATAAWTETAPAGGGKLVAVTFDDGPGQYTDGLLDEAANE